MGSPTRAVAYALVLRRNLSKDAFAAAFDDLLSDDGKASGTVIDGELLTAPDGRTWFVVSDAHQSQRDLVHRLVETLDTPLTLIEADLDLAMCDAHAEPDETSPDEALQVQRYRVSDRGIRLERTLDVAGWDRLSHHQESLRLVLLEQMGLDDATPFGLPVRGVLASRFAALPDRLADLAEKIAVVRSFSTVEMEGVTLAQVSTGDGAELVRVSAAELATLVEATGIQPG